MRNIGKDSGAVERNQCWDKLSNSSTPQAESQDMGGTFWTRIMSCCLPSTHAKQPSYTVHIETITWGSFLFT